MASCGGIITTSGVVLDPGARTLVVGEDEGRQALSVKSSPDNTDTIYLLSGPTVPTGDGWPLAPGEGFIFGGSSSLSAGPRAKLYAVCSSRAILHTIAESGTF